VPKTGIDDGDCMAVMRVRCTNPYAAI